MWRNGSISAKTGTFLFVVVLISFCCSFSDADPLRTCDFRRGNCDLIADYLIAGSGSGSLIARLVTDDTRYSAILLEAGDNFASDPMIAESTNVLGIGGNAVKYNWLMKDTAARDLSLGKMVGGSTSHNGMQYTWVSPAFAAIWQQYGGEVWSPSNIAQAFKAMENYTISGGGSVPSSRGTQGLLNVRKPLAGPTSGANSLANVLANWTSIATGIPVNPDYNNPSGTPFGPFTRYQVTQFPDGKRESSWTAAFPASVLNEDGTSVGNRQLRVFYRSRVTKVLFRGTKAVGLVFLKDGEEEVAYARKEVILACSVFTSQILQNSGVGPADLLTANGIKVVVNNTNVGKHLTNHASMFLPFTVNESHLGALLPEDPAALYAGGGYFPDWTVDGPVSNPSSIQGARQFQLGWFFFPFTPPLMFISHLQPKSSGYEKIQNKNPLDVPYHDEMIFSNSDDVDAFASFLYHGAQNTIMDYLHSQDPAYGSGWGRWNSVEEAKAFILANSARAYHYSGQARIALTAADGVVDAYCRVFGTTGLRVAGAPVLPKPADGTLAAPSLMVAYRVAQFIIADRTNH